MYKFRMLKYDTLSWYTIVYKNTVYKLKAWSEQDAMTRAKKCHEQNMSHLRSMSSGNKW